MKMEEMSKEWETVMVSVKKMEDMMKGMDMTGMEEMNSEWMKMRESMGKLNDMMMKKGW
jgi:hypothetical protein